MSPPRRTVVAGNWKMNLRRATAREYCRRLVEEGASGYRSDVLLFPPFPLLPLLQESLVGTGVEWGGQDLHPEEDGAHTGDVSADHLLDCGCSAVLCGHSERRAEHAEGDALVASKVKAAQAHGLIPLLCLGETQVQRDAGDTEAVLRRQLELALPSGAWILAYEPIWAIGTGHSATPELAQEAHSFLRRIVGELAGPSVSETVRILYGGSVNPENCRDLLDQEDIDGFLIGGASLDPSSFLDIIRRCGTHD